MMVIQEERTHKIFRLANKLLLKQFISIPLIMHMNSKPFYFMEIFMIICNQHLDKNYA